MSPVEFIVLLIGLVAFIVGYFAVSKLIDFFKKGSVIDESQEPVEAPRDTVDAEYLPPPPPNMSADDVRKKQDADYKTYLDEQKRRN
jgi:hypothetical protein